MKHIVARHAFLMLCIVPMILVTGCATYHQQHLPFHNAISAGDYDSAAQYLQDKPKLAKGRNKLLYYLDLGSALHLAGRYAESNDAFEQAYIFLEEFSRNLAMETMSFITNPAVVAYSGEDFEKVQLHYFKALNFALQGNYNDAIVECRRINIKLNLLNDRYEAGKKNRYHNDAFAWYLMGMLFDATSDYNNAFICYRNALEAYESDYSSFLNLNTPDQLKHDLLVSAQRSGLSDEYSFYSDQFQIKNSTQPDMGSTGELIVFWNNGLGPIKTENSINFYLDRGDIGMLNFVSDDQQIFLPVPVGGKDNNNLTDISFIRMALPEYQERVPVYYSADLLVNSQSYAMTPVQDINRIAMICLEDRMGRELGTALLRLALKQALEHAIRNEDESLGVAISIINAISEQADTRNWQTLPHTVYFSRITLPAGTHTIQFIASDLLGQTSTVTDTTDISAGHIQFLEINSPNSMP